MKPTVGRIVLFTLLACHVDAIKDQRARSDGKLVGNEPKEGDVYPLEITKTWGDEPTSAFNGQLKLDGNDTLWLTSVSIKEEATPGYAHWPVRERPV